MVELKEYASYWDSCEPQDMAGIPPAKCKSIIISSPAGEIRAIWGTFLEISSNKSKSTWTPSTSLANAGICSAVLEESPNAMSITIALLNDSWVKISDGLMSFI